VAMEAAEVGEPGATREEAQAVGETAAVVVAKVVAQMEAGRRTGARQSGMW